MSFLYVGVFMDRYDGVTVGGGDEGWSWVTAGFRYILTVYLSNLVLLWPFLFMRANHWGLLSLFS